MILYVILFLLFLLLFYKQHCIETMVNTDTSDQAIIKAINKAYMVDVEAIRNLSEVATKLQAGGLTIPGDLSISGNLNLLPKGIIVAWNSNVAPLGWAICDGNNGTPDLRNRFILGSDPTHLVGTKGGAETTMLKTENIPEHKHEITSTYNDWQLLYPKTLNMPLFQAGVSLSAYTPMVKETIPKLDVKDLLSNTTANKILRNENITPINIIPPYYVLTYIIKI
jgi:microcystin-dependent protein